MFNIASYLEKFKNIGQGEKSIKEAILLSIKEVVGIDLESKAILVKNGEVLLKVSPGIKSAIFIKKVEILKRIKDKVNNPITDLR